MNVNDLVNLINDLKVSKKEITVLSTAALVLRNIIKEANDLDLAVTEEGLRQLKANYDVKKKTGEENWYIVNDKVECVLDNMEGKRERYFSLYLQDINNYLEYIKASDREKDKARIPLVEKYLKKRELVQKYKVIETDRLILRKAKETDLESMFNNIWSDHEIASMMLWKPIDNIEEAEDRINRNIDFQRDYISHFITLKGSDEVIGFSGINEVEPHIFSDYGLCIAKKYQGMGLATEILEKYKEIVFDEFNAKKFIYTCFKGNDKSSALCKKCGFVYFGSEAEVRKHDGLNYVKEKYYMDKDMYMEQKKQKNR